MFLTEILSEPEVSKGTVTRTTSCQHTLSKKTSTAHWRDTVVLKSK